MKLEDILQELKDVVDDHACAGIYILLEKYENKFVIGTCSDCDKRSKDKICPTYHALMFIFDPKEFGCIHWEEKKSIQKMNFRN